MGKYVRAGNNVAMIASVDGAEIVVPLPLDDLRWLSIPRQGNFEKGSIATVRLEVGSNIYQWQGHLVRSLGEVDMRSRMAQVVVRVDDPYELLAEVNTQKLNLELGMFVEVVFQGETLTGLVEIPRAALRENSTVWIMDSDQKLQIISVEIVRQQKDTVLIGSGLEDGDLVILTTLPGGVDGMALRQVQEEDGR